MVPANAILDSITILPATLEEFAFKHAQTEFLPLRVYASSALLILFGILQHNLAIVNLASYHPLKVSVFKPAVSVPQLSKAFANV